MRAEAAVDKSVGTMRSPINWALLGLVIGRPSYGYELARRHERVYGDVQPVSGDSHIYKALDALERRSLISGTPGPRPVSSGTDRQRKLHYRATPAGEQSYQEHLIEQLREDRRRSQMLIRQLAVYESRPLVALEILQRGEAACVEEAVRAPGSPSSDGSPVDVGSELIARLAAEERRLAMEAKLPWFRYARREFRALAEGRSSRR
jgi:DNA-binding PadR family transcriptional regulator